MARPRVPHCRDCDKCLLKVAKGGGYHRLCGGVTTGPPAPMLNEEIRHTSPDWCPKRYGTILRLEWERVPNDIRRESR